MTTIKAHVHVYFTCTCININCINMREPSVSTQKYLLNYFNAHMVLIKTLYKFLSFHKFLVLQDIFIAMHVHVHVQYM